MVLESCGLGLHDFLEKGIPTIDSYLKQVHVVQHGSDPAINDQERIHVPNESLPACETVVVCISPQAVTSMQLG